MFRSWRAKLWRPLTLLVILISVIYAGMCLWLWNAGIDDAGISWRYARHLADGQGLRWNLEGPPVEGYSNFLWVLILAGCGWIGIEIELASKVLGLLLGGVNLALLGILSARLWGNRSFWWAPVLLVVATPEWTMWAASGLEIPLFGFLILVTALALTDARKPNNFWLAIAVSGLVLTRPEGLAVGLFVFLGIVLIPGQGRWRDRLRSVWVPMVVVLGVAAGLLLFRLSYFGYLFPNSVYAKFDLSMPSWPLALLWLAFGIPFWIAWALWLRDKDVRGSVGILLLPLVILAHTAMTLPVSPVMNYLHRYHVALLPLLVVAAPALLAFANGRKRVLSGLIAVLLVAWCLQGAVRVEERAEREQQTRAYQQCIAALLQELPGRPIVALQDAGRIPYWSDLPTIDAWGLCDVAIAHQGFSPEAILSRYPEVYIVSADSVHWGGLAAPRLGFDKYVYVVPGFLDQYGLWRHCLPMNKSGDGAYGYAILLDIDYAGKYRIPLLPHPRVTLQN